MSNVRFIVVVALLVLCVSLFAGGAMATIAWHDLNTETHPIGGTGVAWISPSPPSCGSKTMAAPIGRPLTPSSA